MIYFDNASTSWPKPEIVYKSMESCMRKCANPGRSGHKMSIEAGRIVYNTRELIGELFGVKKPNQIIFTSNGTLALNLGIKGLLKKGDHVITSSLEHNSVMRPLRYLEGKGKIEITVVWCSEDGRLDVKEIEKAIKDNTRLVVITHASNVIGTILPIKEVGRIVKRYNILFMVDAAQTAGVLPINVEDFCIDLLAFTGHKSLFGPQGTGGLYIREGIEIEPLTQGGTGSNSELEVHPDFLPDKYESGTHNTVGLAGLGAGVRFILEEGIENIRNREKELTSFLLKALKDMDEITIYGPKDPELQTSIVSFNINGLESNEAGYVLDQAFDIMTRTGLHCAPSAHKTIGTFPRGTIRFSLGYFNTKEEIDCAVKSLKKILVERRISR
ncbi:MAG: aminotransferase class V-fold PLP-dependent enzyme [bacterium]|nr:aminotransferase class V-fold PLP-dependent enzyme [bacterium]